LVEDVARKLLALNDAEARHESRHESHQVARDRIEQRVVSRTHHIDPAQHRAAQLQNVSWQSEWGRHRNLRLLPRMRLLLRVRSLSEPIHNQFQNTSGACPPNIEGLQAPICGGLLETAQRRVQERGRFRSWAGILGLMKLMKLTRLRTRIVSLSHQDTRSVCARFGGHNVCFFVGLCKNKMLPEFL
jgi:hypothetical protein